MTLLSVYKSQDCNELKWTIVQHINVTKTGCLIVLKHHLLYGFNCVLAVDSSRQCRHMHEYFGRKLE